MEEIPVVTCLLCHEGRILLLRRSTAVGSYPGAWGGVAGHVATDVADPTTRDRENQYVGCSSGDRSVSAVSNDQSPKHVSF